ncbi:MAG TPA: NADH-quinone oxidoreductase subunit D [Firmicutes bacterium]|nr:NADH-quinone oxidoreductase subunit D [Bacillota bacterium]
MITQSGEKRTQTLNLGPQHPATHGVLRLELELDGETIISCKPIIGYLHTGIEKTAETKTWHQAIVLFDRMDYLAPMSNNMAYIGAVEKLCGIEVPEYAKTIRVILLELTRLKSHLVWLGTHAMDIGAMTVFLYCFREREKILDIYESVSGSRMMSSYFQEGGLWRDVPDDFADRVVGSCNDIHATLNECRKLLYDNPIWRKRTEGIGIIRKKDVLAHGLSGPIARASGIEWDIRKSNPYSGYETYDFEIPTHEEGDVFARYDVRLREMEQSILIIEQALFRLNGVKREYRAHNPVYIPPSRNRISKGMEDLIRHFKFYTSGYPTPEGRVYFAVEAPKGELGFFISSDGSEKPHRLKVRGPSFSNVAFLEQVAPMHLISDLVAIIGSIDIVLGEIDR